MLKFFLIFIIPVTLFSQNINHWETVVLEDNIWKYFEGTYEPDSNWRSLSYNDSSWMQGQGGIGYGDGDDNTIINQVSSLYLRKVFNIVDSTDILNAVLDIDYDDAFVAYLNNVEIARSNIGVVGDYPLFNQGSSSYHEAQMYQGGNPEQFLINTNLLDTILNQGDNVLCIQIHNENINSSDLSSRIFFSLAINSNSYNYLPVPNWFVPPFIFSSSNLPIVILNTNGNTIVDDPRITCDMGIIDNGFGNINNINDLYNDYNGKISIEYRGSSSQTFPKKSYGLETQDSLGNNNNVSLLGMPTENDWILYAPYTDKALMRNFLTFDLGRKMGNYSPRTRYCELVVNGEYRGVYILMEKIKRDNDRVDIAKLDSNDVAGDSLTGGYIIKFDKYTGTGGADWLSDFPNIGGGTRYIQYHYPEATSMQPQQKNYIENYVDSFEYALAGPNFTDSLIGYSRYIDVQSFIDLYIINELSRNIDGYRLSTYMFKDRENNGGKLTMGPFWDYNLAYGNADYCEGGLTAGWEVDGDGGACGWNNPFWFERLLDDTTYQNSLKCRWEFLRGNCLHEDSIFNFIDSVAYYLDSAQQRNFTKWDILGSYVWPNFYVGNTFQDELNFFKNWIYDRLLWIDNNLDGECYEILGCTDYNACNFNLSANADDGSCIFDTSLNQIVNICYGEDILIGNNLYNSAGNYIDTLTALNGCDSILYSQIIVNNTAFSFDTLISSSTITWNGINLASSGDYTFMLENILGCDSIANLNLTILTNTNISYYNSDRKLLKVTDILGRDYKAKNRSKNITLIYIYDDGSIEKKYIFE